MVCQRISESSNWCKAGLVLGAASIITLVALGVVFRGQVPSLAKKFGALYVKGPLQIQLPLVGASAALGTYLLLHLGSFLYGRQRGDGNRNLQNPAFADKYK